MDSKPEPKRVNYDPAFLSDKWTFKRGEVANFFFNRSYQWLAKIEAKGFEVPDGLSYEPIWDSSGNRVYHLVDVDSLASCLAYNRIIDGEKALRIYSLLEGFSSLWQSR